MTRHFPIVLASRQWNATDWAYLLYNNPIQSEYTVLLIEGRAHTPNKKFKRKFGTEATILTGNLLEAIYILEDLQ